MLRLLLVAGVAVGCALASDFDQGIALVKKGDYAAAEPLLLSAARENPRDARVWASLGVLYAAQGDYGQAEPAFRRACDLNPKLPDACYYEGRALYALDRYEASLEALRRAPDSWQVKLGMAEALEALGRAPEAEAEFKAASAAAGNQDPEPQTALGRFLIRQARTDEAVALLEPLVARFPETPGARIELGRALLERGKLDGAIAQLERAVALSPGSTQAHLLLAKAYVRAGKTEEARPHFEAARRHAKK